MKTKIRRLPGPPYAYEVSAWVGDVRAREVVHESGGGLDPRVHCVPEIVAARQRVRAKVRAWLRCAL